MANSAQLRNEIAAGKWDDKLRALYGDAAQEICRQRARYCAALEQFELYFGLGRQGKFPVSPEAPSQRGLSAQQTGGVSDSVFTAHPGWRYTHPWKRNGRGCARPSDGWWKGL